MKKNKPFTQSRHEALGWKFRTGLFVLLMTIGGTQFSHAEETTEILWNYLALNYGTCGVNENSSISFNGLNYTGSDIPSKWNGFKEIRTTYNGYVNYQSKQIVMSVWEHKETVPSYTKRTVTWNYKHQMYLSSLWHSSGVYFFDTENTAKSTSVDATYNCSNEAGSSYRNTRHYDTTNNETQSWDVTATLVFDNKNDSNQQSVGKYLLMTDITGSEAGTYSSNNWIGLSSTSWSATDTYYNVITFDSNGGTGTMERQTVGSGEALPQNTFVRENYQFAGWSENPNAVTATYTDKQLWSVTEASKGEKKLYAVWSECVTFHHSELRYYQANADSPEYRNFSDLQTDYANSDWYKSKTTERTVVGNSGTLPMTRNSSNPAIVRYNTGAYAEDCFDWFYLTAAAPSYTKIKYEVSFVFRPYNYSTNGVRFAVFDYGSDYDKWNSRASDPNGNTSFRTATGMSTEAMHYNIYTYDGEFGAEYVYNYNTGYMWSWNYAYLEIDNSKMSTSDTSKAYYGLSCSKTNSSSAYNSAVWLGIELTDTVYTYYNNVIYNANGGSGNMENDIITKDDVISENTFTREGREFLGWNDYANGKVATYADEQAWGDVTRESKGDKNIYALWINRGDADTDDDFTINDFNCIKNYTLGTKAIPAENTLYFQNSDANKDGDIDASDCQMIPELIFTAGANKAKSSINNEQLTINSVDGFGYTVNGDELTISAENAQQFLACQMDILLPKGVSISDRYTDGKHEVASNVLDNGMIRLLITSPTVDTFNNNKVVTLKLSSSVNNKPLTFNNAIFTNKAFQSINAQAGETTSIDLTPTLSQGEGEENGKFIENNRVVIKHSNKKFNAAGQEMK